MPKNFIELLDLFAGSLVYWQPHQVLGLSLLLAALVPGTVQLLCLHPRIWARLRSMHGVEPAMIGSVAVLFSLFAAFLANDIWARNQAAHTAVEREADGIQMMVRLTDGLVDAESKLMRRALEGHVTIAVEDEWPRMLEGQASKKADAKISAIAATIITFEVGKSEGPEFQSRLLGAFNQIRENWRIRIAIAQDRKLSIKWYGALLFGLLTQISIGVVHISNRKAMLVAQVIFGIAFAMLSAMLFVNEFPFSQMAPISVAPLQAALSKS